MNLNIVDITERIYDEKNYLWKITVNNAENERFYLMRSNANNQIMIFISIKSFDNLKKFKQEALNQIRKHSGEIEYVF